MRGADRSPTTLPVSATNTASVPVTSPSTEPPITTRAPGDGADDDRARAQCEVPGDPDVTLDATQDLKGAIPVERCRESPRSC